MDLKKKITKLSDLLLKQLGILQEKYLDYQKYVLTQAFKVKDLS